MKKLLALLVAAGFLTGVTGCPNSSTTPTKSGTTKQETKKETHKETPDPTKEKPDPTKEKPGKDNGK